jgi:hypothetical protein
VARYDSKDVCFEVPDGWENRSVISFQQPGPPSGKLNTNVTMMRDYNRPATTPLATYMMQQVSTLASVMPRFELVSQKNVTFGGLPAIEILYDWSTPDGAVRQRITIFERRGETWTFTASAMKSAFEKAQPDFDKLAASVTFAAGDAGPPVGPSFGKPWSG